MRKAENYSLCGGYSICNMDGNVPTCECVKGYVPKFPQQWQISYQSNGFLRYCKMKFPDTSSSWFSKIMDLEECRTCSAYANLDICGRGSGCLL